MKQTDLLQFVEVKKVVPSGLNPRTINEKSAGFTELVDSIRGQGVMVPVHVRRHPKDKGKLELLAGDRRLRACIKARRDRLPAINHGELSDEAAFEVTFAENFAREDLTPLEQGRAVATLLEKYKNDLEAVASKMGKSIKWVRQRQALGTKLIKRWKTALATNESFQDWTAGHLQLIASLPDAMQRQIFATYQYRHGPPHIQFLAKEIAQALQLLSKAPFDTAQSGCQRCQKRTSCQPGLFDDTLDPVALKKNDRCLDPVCWRRLVASALLVRFKSLKERHRNLVPIATDYLGPNIREEVEKNWPGLLTQYQWGQARKKDKGSVPGLIVQGRAAGTILWIKPAGSCRRTQARAAKGTPTPLAQRRIALAAKRGAQFLNDLCEVIEQKKVADLAVDDKTSAVMALADVFGVDDAHTQSSASTAPWKAFDKLLDAKPNEVRKSLWLSVRSVLVSNVAYSGPVTQTPKENIDAGKRLARLFNLNIAAMEKQIAEKLPEPKAWATLNADGTPKKKKDKAAAKQKKSAPKKKVKAKARKAKSAA